MLRLGLAHPPRKGSPMDADLFDRLARSLTAAGSRRRALATFSAVLGGALGVSVVDETAAKKKCPPCKKRKGGKCKKKKPDGAPCSGGTCQRGRCTTAPAPPPPPACSAEADFCANGTPSCGDSAVCVRPLGGGASRCGTFNSLTCGCTTHEQCVGLLGAGAFCAQAGPECPCNTGTAFCSAPR
jgi:hypothetical protein